MKRIRLILLLLLSAPVLAQEPAPATEESDETPSIYVFAAREVYSGSDLSPQTTLPERQAINMALQDYIDTHRPGFAQVEKPQLVLTTRNSRFSFSIGGFVNLRAGYDFEGSVDNLDFITYDIPVHSNYDTRQKLMLDASTSRLFLKGIARTSALGRVVLFMDFDFRGGATDSYTPRVRSAYIAFRGFTIGRDATTFCDLTAAPTTIDFQGPNAYNFNFATLLRYEHAFANKCLKFGIAAEMPHVSGTYNDYFAPLKQRMPDFPAYIQVAWGRNRISHLRFSGVIRNLYAHNLRSDRNTSLLGWGVQLSGTIKVARLLQFFMNGVYGKGITPYIQDLTGSGLDFTPDPTDPGQIQTMPMWGWQTAAQINLSRRLFLSMGYSTVRVQQNHGYYTADQYKKAQYIFGNVFFSITSRCRIAAEYLYGTRKNMDNAKGHANRINAMIQYNF